MNKYKMFDQRLANELSKCKVKCRCGHSVIVPSGKSEWVICGWCGHRIFRDQSKQSSYDKKCDFEEFRFKLNGYLKNYSNGVR